MEGVAGDKAEMQMARSWGLPRGQANRLFFTPEALNVFEEGRDLVEAELLNFWDYTVDVGLGMMRDLGSLLFCFLFVC